MGGFDLIWDGGPVAHGRSGSLSSSLGTFSPSAAAYAGVTKASGKADAARAAGEDVGESPAPSAAAAGTPDGGAASGAGAASAALPRPVSPIVAGTGRR